MEDITSLSFQCNEAITMQCSNNPVESPQICFHCVTCCRKQYHMIFSPFIVDTKAVRNIISFCILNWDILDKASWGKECGLCGFVYKNIVSCLCPPIVFGQKCQLPSIERSTLLFANQLGLLWGIIISLFCLIFHLKLTRALTLSEGGFINNTNSAFILDLT